MKTNTINIDEWMLRESMQDVEEALVCALELIRPDEHSLREFVFQCAGLANLYEASCTTDGLAAYVNQAAVVGFIADSTLVESGAAGIMDADYDDLTVAEKEALRNWEDATIDICWFVCGSVSGLMGGGMFSHPICHAAQLLHALCDLIEVRNAWDARNGGAE